MKLDSGEARERRATGGEVLKPRKNTATCLCARQTQEDGRGGMTESPDFSRRKDQPKRQPVVLVPTDFSTEAEKTLDVATNLARQLGGRLVLFHAVHLNLTPYGPANPAWLSAALCQEAMQKAEPLLLRAQAAGVPAMCVVEPGAQSAAILRAAEKWQADMILLMTRQRRWFERLFRRRIYERVIRKARCPVLVLQMDR